LRSALAPARGPPHIWTIMLLRLVIVGLTLFALAAAPLRAQTQKQTPAEDQPQSQPQAPFDGSLARLSEILGALHYLRTICGSKEGQKWRNEMQSLIDAETPTGERRSRMIASFNRGYQGFQQTYRTCTPAADFAIRRYLEEGSRIARDITGRYAN
jgi:uncharacterized protein (TIGR02301 family)